MYWIFQEKTAVPLNFEESLEMGIYLDFFVWIFNMDAEKGGIFRLLLDEPNGEESLHFTGECPENTQF